MSGGRLGMKLVMKNVLKWFNFKTKSHSNLPDHAPTVPDDMRVYAIGDIHGERNLLDLLYEMIEQDAKSILAAGGTAVIVHLGDYIDRGPDSRGVVDRLTTPLNGCERRFLLGNHEMALLRFLAAPETGIEWLRYGGAETLASYGVAPTLGDDARMRRLAAALRERMPESHRAFLEKLEPYVVIGDYAFVHAGVAPGAPLERQSLDALLWMREPFLSSSAWHGRVIVHGHTIADAPEDLFNRIGVDTGAYASGVLTCVALQGAERRFIATDSVRA